MDYSGILQYIDTIILSTNWKDSTLPEIQTPTNSQDDAAGPIIRPLKLNETSPINQYNTVCISINEFFKAHADAHLFNTAPLYITKYWNGHGCSFGGIEPPPENDSGHIKFITNIPPGIFNVTLASKSRLYKQNTILEEMIIYPFPDYKEQLIKQLNEKQPELLNINYQFAYIKQILLNIETNLDVRERIRNILSGKGRVIGEPLTLRVNPESRKYLDKFMEIVQQEYNRINNEMPLYNEMISFSKIDGDAAAVSGFFLMMDVDDIPKPEYNFKNLEHLYTWAEQGVRSDILRMAIKTYLLLQQKVPPLLINRVVLFTGDEVIHDISIVCAYHIVALCLFYNNNKNLFNCFNLLILTTNKFMKKINSKSNKQYNHVQLYIYNKYWEGLSSLMVRYSNIYSTDIAITPCRSSCTHVSAIGDLSGMTRRGTNPVLRQMSADSFEQIQLNKTRKTELMALMEDYDDDDDDDEDDKIAADAAAADVNEWLYGKECYNFTDSIENYTPNINTHNAKKSRKINFKKSIKNSLLNKAIRNNDDGKLETNQIEYLLAPLLLHNKTNGIKNKAKGIPNKFKKKTKRRQKKYTKRRQKKQKNKYI